MTPEQIKDIKSFSINWITNVIAKRKDYRERLLEAINDLFPDNIQENNDNFFMLDCKNWDSGESRSDSGMGDRLNELIVYNNIYEFTKKAKNDFICTIRIAIDLFIHQSSGVVGYTIGDLRKAFNGNIPVSITAEFAEDISNAKDSDPVWL